MYLISIYIESNNRGSTLIQCGNNDLSNVKINDQGTLQQARQSMFYSLYNIILFFFNN